MSTRYCPISGRDETVLPGGRCDHCLAVHSRFDGPPATPEQERLSRIRANRQELEATERNLDDYRRFYPALILPARMNPVDRKWIEDARERVTRLTAAIEADEMAVAK